MSFQIVQCEVRWVVKIGYSGDELPTTCSQYLGEFHTEDAAEAALTAAGFTKHEWRWKDATGYGAGHVSRVLFERK
jgi:hypothetical protein|tara:strand:+ start:593 stop:820 length:228 start_codon:yes stop_codon:yes gene_type:complete